MCSGWWIVELLRLPVVPATRRIRSPAIRVRHSGVHSNSSERETRLQTLVAKMSRQFHTLGYDWNDVPYYRSPPTQSVSTPVLPVDADHELGACAKSGLGHEPNERECVMDRPRTFMAPVDSQKTLFDAGVKRAVDSRSAGKNVMKPQRFDGKEPVNSFWAHFEVCANFNGWSEEEKISWFQWSLKGRAQQMLWDLPSDQAMSYADLSRRLKQRFGSENQCEVYKLELRNRRRGPRENLSDLMQDVRRLMVLAYSAQTSEMWESVAINAFLEAVDDPDLALEVGSEALRRSMKHTEMLYFWKVL